MIIYKRPRQAGRSAAWRHGGRPAFFRKRLNGFGPHVSALLASADLPIYDFVFAGCDRGFSFDILLLAEQRKRKAKRESEQPEENVNNPPPGAYEYPPQQTVLLLLVL